MFCPNCGTQNPDAAQTCSKCNFHLKSAAAPKFKGTMLMMNQPGVLPGSPSSPPPPQAPPPARPWRRIAAASGRRRRAEQAEGDHGRRRADGGGPRTLAAAAAPRRGHPPTRRTGASWRRGRVGVFTAGAAAGREPARRHRRGRRGRVRRIAAQQGQAAITAVAPLHGSPPRGRELHAAASSRIRRGTTAGGRLPVPHGVPPSYGSSPGPGFPPPFGVPPPRRSPGSSASSPAGHRSGSPHGYGADPYAQPAHGRLWRHDADAWRSRPKGSPRTGSRGRAGWWAPSSPTPGCRSGRPDGTRSSRSFCRSP